MDKALELANELENTYPFVGVMEVAATMLRQQQAEIEALKELNTMLKDAIEKRIEIDANRYQWLRAEFAAGRETYLAEGIPSGESLDKYIDGKLK